MEAALAEVRDLELYAPVAVHREAMTSATLPIVAVALSEDANPFALYPDGTERLLARDYPPPHPVIVLVPVETDLRSQATLNSQGQPEVRCQVGSGETLAKARERCHGKVQNVRAMEAVRAGSPGSAHNLSGLDGLYMEHLELIGDQCHGECWFIGDPEYEIFMAYDIANHSDTEHRPRVCAGDGGSGELHFDMNGSSWTRLQRLLFGAQLEAARTGADSAIIIQLWEADDGWAGPQCVLTPTNDGAVLNAVFIAVLGAYVTTIAVGVNAGAALFGIALMAIAAPTLIFGGDDLVGTFVAAQSNFPATANTNMSLVRSEPNGSVALVGRARVKAYSTTPPSAGPTAAVAMAGVDKLPVGAGKQFSATAVDANGIGAPTRTPTWSSSNSSVASVNASGYVTGVAAGTATINALIDGVTSGYVVEVANYGEAVSVQLSPLGVSINGSQQWQLYVRLYDSNNFELPVNALAGARFEHVYPDVCAVNAAGIVTSLTGSAAWTDIKVITDTGLESNAIPCSVNGGNAYLRAPATSSTRVDQP